MFLLPLDTGTEEAEKKRILKMEAVGFSAMLITSYENTWCYNPEDQNLLTTRGFSTLAMEYMSKKCSSFSLV
jgi:hypothetical protein